MSTVVLRAEDKASRQYWDRGYDQSVGKAPFDPHNRELRAFWKRGLHQYFVEVLGGPEAGRSLLEVGCGDSRMLPYFAKEFGLIVDGIDYSEPGCNKARSNLAEEHVSGNIIYADLFSPPVELLHTYDVIFSFGVVEHFLDTARCLRAFKELLKPGGLVITIVPNMAGLIGTCQRIVDRKVFDIHVVLDREALAKAHTDAGFRVMRCEYLLFINFGLLNINSARAGTAGYRARLAILSAFKAVTAASWALESAFRPGRANRFTSPYVVCAATCDLYENSAEGNQR